MIEESDSGQAEMTLHHGSEVPPQGHGPVDQTDGVSCADCGAPNAPHRGELTTTRVADGVVRDGRVRRCTHCHIKRPRYVPDELGAGQWAIRDRQHDTIVVNIADSTPLLYTSRDEAQAGVDRLVARGAL